MTLSPAIVEQMMAQQSPDTAIVLTTFTHAALPQPLRFCTVPLQRLSLEPLTYGLTSRGQVHRFLPMEVLLPGDEEGAAPRGRIVLDDVAGPDPDGNLVRASDLLRLSPASAKLLFEIVRAATPDVVEQSWPELEMSRAPIANGAISIELSAMTMEREPCPCDRLTPGVAPTLFSA
ncbi:hypothetical protein FFK22_008775 [Mycobacterium sp. KBS0706]|uniref:hypothetical protein n=1 Tax=Mycobacterium sp. KBS0706 TaxID=2578109 RepID=UPI00110FAF08|nr:hypothetical protein [Mycobacterium sp. KBS0706]TSD89066.1 hypothetical protein FFK22_008775 [Mycobacterium sp. KBS0706]